MVLTTSFVGRVLLFWRSLGVGVPTPEPSWKVRSAQVMNLPHVALRWLAGIGCAFLLCQTPPVWIHIVVFVSPTDLTLVRILEDLLSLCHATRCLCGAVTTSFDSCCGVSHHQF